MPTDEFGYRVTVQGSRTDRRVQIGQLADALRWALADPAGAATRGSAARERILRSFNNARFGELMAALMDQLAGAAP
jgi:hypothetical protein